MCYSDRNDGFSSKDSDYPIKHSFDDKVIDKIILENSLNMSSGFIHTPYALEVNLYEAIATGSLENSLKALDLSNERGKVVLSNDKLKSWKYNLIISTTIFTRAAISGGADYERTFLLSDSCIKEIDRLNTVEECIDYEKYMLRLFVNLVNLSQQETDHDYSQLIIDTRTFIKNNVSQKLTLEDIAEAVNVHPNYLSSRFKKECNQGIIEYYNKEKVILIQYYLKCTNYNISEIAYMFKFNSVSNFSAFFSKQTSISPSEYRKRNS